MSFLANVALDLLALAFPERVRGSLEAYAEHALRAGVRPSLVEWRALASVEREAWVVAGDRLAAARAGQLGIAASSPEAATEIASFADGGKAKEAYDRAARTVSLQRAADDLRKRYGGE